ncbi:hypothetical protein K438DRAFT_1789051 [Mycena galopus ATCC 62051]|nr:hypothetical protein K438DRAFT_1789051 [Mycena galopus ATCC 62051]
MLRTRPLEGSVRKRFGSESGMGSKWWRRWGAAEASEHRNRRHDTVKRQAGGGGRPEQLMFSHHPGFEEAQKRCSSRWTQGQTGACFLPLFDEDEFDKTCAEKSASARQNKIVVVDGCVKNIKGVIYRTGMEPQKTTVHAQRVAIMQRSGIFGVYSQESDEINARALAGIDDEARAEKWESTANAPGNTLSESLLVVCSTR